MTALVAPRAVSGTAAKISGESAATASPAIVAYASDTTSVLRAAARSFCPTSLPIVATVPTSNARKIDHTLHSTGPAICIPASDDASWCPSIARSTTKTSV